MVRIAALLGVSERTIRRIPAARRHPTQATVWAAYMRRSGHCMSCMSTSTRLVLLGRIFIGMALVFVPRMLTRSQ